MGAVKRLVVSLVFVGATLVPLVVPSVALAQGAACEPKGSILGFPTWYKYLEGEPSQGKCRPVIDTSEDTLPIGLAVFEIMLTLAGLIAVVMVFIGSFKYVITVGEPDKATAARKTVINALIGLAITVIAAQVVSFIAGRLSG